VNEEHGRDEDEAQHGADQLLNTIDYQLELAVREHSLWTECFASSSARTAALNRLGGSFFGVIHRSVRDSLIARLSRLFDPAKQRGRENDGFWRLATVLSDADGASARSCGSELKEALNDTPALLRRLRTARHRTVGHNDAKHYDQSDQVKLTLDELDSALDVAIGLVEIVNKWLRPTRHVVFLQTLREQPQSLAIRSRLARPDEDSLPEGERDALR
jgi:AbiU2